MSIDIKVYVGPRPKTLRTVWQAAFAETGMTCEFRTDYDAATWTAGDFVVKLRVAKGGRFGTFVVGQ